MNLSDPGGEEVGAKYGVRMVPAMLFVDPANEKMITKGKSHKAEELVKEMEAVVNAPSPDGKKGVEPQSSGGR